MMSTDVLTFLSSSTVNAEILNKNGAGVHLPLKSMQVRNGELFKPPFPYIIHVDLYYQV